MDPKHVKPASAAAQALGWVDEKTRAVTPAIHPSTTYLRDEDNQYRTGNIYGRPDNATVREAVSGAVTRCPTVGGV